MKTKRINAQGLRRLIMSEVKRLREGGPGQDFGDNDELTDDCVAAAVGAFENAHPYDEGADSGELGADAWDQQVQSALTELGDQLEDAMRPIVQSVTQRLYDGEFYVQGRGEAMSAGREPKGGGRFGRSGPGNDY